jgi:selenocysteine lyase/cysteine desulfurase
MDPAEIRALFPGLRDSVYLNTATMGVGCAAAQEALSAAVEQWTRGRFDWTDAERAGEDARRLFAAMIGAGPDEIAIVPAASTAAGLVAANLPPAHQGENVVVAAHEFSSNYFPWVQLKDRGYTVRTIAPPDRALSEECFSEAADGGTRLIAVSAVQSSDGYRADLAAISRIAARSGAWLFVDASQAAGALPLDVVRDGVDFLVAVSYKFLSGPRGIGYLFVRRALLDRLQPLTPGWKAAREPMESFYGPSMELSSTASKLDTSLVWFAAVAELATRRMFEQVGLQAIFDRNASLTRRLHAAIEQAFPKYRLFPEPHRSQIVSIPVADSAAAMRRLRESGVVASMRAGRIRLSSHFYNREEEIDKAVALLARDGH